MGDVFHHTHSPHTSYPAHARITHVILDGCATSLMCVCDEYDKSTYVMHRIILLCV